MKDKKIIAIIVLAAVLIFGLVGYLLLLSEKEGLLNSLDQVKGQLTVLESENRSLLVALEKERQLRQQLTQEKAALEQNVYAQEEKLASLTDVQKTIDALNARIAALSSKAQTLKEDSVNLKLKLAEATKENEILRGGRQSSVAELKKAIKELKRQVRQVKRQIKEKSKDVAVSGNRGFLVRDGRSTYPVKVRIEVTPAQ